MFLGTLFLLTKIFLWLRRKNLVQQADQLTMVEEKEQEDQEAQEEVEKNNFYFLEVIFGLGFFITKTA